MSAPYMTVLFPALCVSDSQVVLLTLYKVPFRVGGGGGWGQQEGLPGEGQIGLVVYAHEGIT